MSLPSPDSHRPTEGDKRRADQFKISPEEFVKRDKIVRQLYLDCPFRTGEVIRPLTDQSFEEYGNCTIRGIFKSYHDFPTAEAMAWPEDNIPFILTIQPEKGDAQLLLVTSGFLKKPK